jgi:hypothetical protein
MSWKKYDFIRQSKRAPKVIYCIRQLFENTIDRKYLIESILTIEPYFSIIRFDTFENRLSGLNYNNFGSVRFLKYNRSVPSGPDRSVYAGVFFFKCFFFNNFCLRCLIIIIFSKK